MAHTLANLVHNAVAHGEAHGHVGVVLETTPDTFTLMVLDDGPGVAPTEIPRIGERTFRSDRARQRDPAGGGLGLAIVGEVCQRAGFMLKFASEPPRGLRATVEGRRGARLVGRVTRDVNVFQDNPERGVNMLDAEEWRFIASAPRVGFLATSEPEFDFLDFAEASRLVKAMRYAHLTPEVGRSAVLLLDAPVRSIVDRSGHDLDTIGTKIPT